MTECLYHQLASYLKANRLISVKHNYITYLHNCVWLKSYGLLSSSNTQRMPSVKLPATTNMITRSPLQMPQYCKYHNTWSQWRLLKYLTHPL